MILTITNNNKISIIDNKQPRLENTPKDTIKLYDILDELLSINWPKVGLYSLDLDDDDWDVGANLGPFVDYKTFLKWLHEHDCMERDEISKITFELLRINFPTFSRKNWYKFFNAIKLLNSEAYFEGKDELERQVIFSRMFPKLYFCSPFRSQTGNCYDALTRYAFSSNIEMMVYDIFNDLFAEKKTFFSRSKMICHTLLTFFKILAHKYSNYDEPALSYHIYQEEILNLEKELGVLFDESVALIDLHAIETITTESPPVFTRLTRKNKRNFELLFHLLYNTDLHTLLFEEFMTSEYGLCKIPLSNFIETDLIHRFEIKDFIYNCYAKYEIPAKDIFNYNESVNLVLLLGSYASCFSNLSFAKCDTCGNYFVRKAENKMQKRCSLCCSYLNKFPDYIKSKKEIDKIENNINQIKNRLESELDDKTTDLYNTLASFCLKKDALSKTSSKNSIKKEEQTVNRIKELYVELLAEYKTCIKKTLDLAAAEYMHGLYSAIDLFEYGITKTTIQIDEGQMGTKGFIKYEGEDIHIIDFQFKEFFQAYLVKKKYFYTFIQLSNAYADMLEIDQNNELRYKKSAAIITTAKDSIIRLEDILDKLVSIFSDYGLDVTTFVNIKNETLTMLKSWYKENFENLELKVYPHLKGSI